MMAALTKTHCTGPLWSPFRTHTCNSEVKKGTKTGQKAAKFPQVSTYLLAVLGVPDVDAAVCGAADHELGGQVSGARFQVSGVGHQVAGFRY